MKIKLNFGIGKLLLLGLVLLLALAALVVDILILLGVGDLVNFNTALVSVSMVLAILVVGLCLTIFFNSYYSLNGRVFSLCLAFFFDRVDVDSITEIKRDIKGNVIYLVYKPRYAKKEDELTAMRVMIDPKRNHDVVEALMALNTAIIYTEFEPVDKKNTIPKTENETADDAQTEDTAAESNDTANGND